MAKDKGGRPPLNGEARPESVLLRLKPEQKEQLQEIAESQGRPMAQVVYAVVAAWLRRREKRKD